MSIMGSCISTGLRAIQGLFLFRFVQQIFNLTNGDYNSNININYVCNNARGDISGKTKKDT